MEMTKYILICGNKTKKRSTNVNLSNAPNHAYLKIPQKCAYKKCNIDWSKNTILFLYECRKSSLTLTNPSHTMTQTKLVCINLT